MFVLGHGGSSLEICSKAGMSSASLWGFTPPVLLWCPKRILRGWFLSWRVLPFIKQSDFSAEQLCVLHRRMVPPDVRTFYTDLKTAVENHSLVTQVKKKKSQINFCLR